MKTALCFAGTGRSIEYTFDNLRSKIIDDLKNNTKHCDIFVYITDTPKAEIAKKYFEPITEYIDIVKEDFTDPHGSGFVFESDWPPSTRHHPEGYEKGRDIYLKMVRSRKHLVTMMDNTNVKYERVIFSRMDVAYQDGIFSKIQPLNMDFLWLPSFHHWKGGYNDRFAISNLFYMKTYLSQWDYMNQYKNEGFVFQAERALKNHLHRFGITPKIFRYNFKRIRPDGKEHETWDQVENREAMPCDI